MPAALRPGATFSGPVVYVGDGDSLCVGLGPKPAQWVEVRLADVYAPELHEPRGALAKALLVKLTHGQRVDCTAQHRSYDRVVAVCRLGGRLVSDRLREAGAPEGGRGWR